MKPALPIPSATRTAPPLLLCLLALSFALTHSLFAQRAKIPARSASSVNGGTVEVEEPTVSPPTIEGRTFPGKSSVSRVTVPAPGMNKGKVSTSPVRVEDAGERNPRQPVAAVQTLPVASQELDPAKKERLGELRRELRVADSAAWARIGLPADEVFEEDAVTTVDDLAEPTLKKIVEYIHLNDKKNITVKSFYVKEQENAKTIAWSRSLALIEWLAENSNLGEESFQASNPLPVTKPTPKENATSAGEVEFLNRIELKLD